MKTATKSKKSGRTPRDRDAELRRLVEEQRLDAQRSTAPPGEPLLSPDGAIPRPSAAIRDLVAPAPDEILTRAPEED